MIVCEKFVYSEKYDRFNFIEKIDNNDETIKSLTFIEMNEYLNKFIKEINYKINVADEMFLLLKNHSLFIEKIWLLTY